MVSWRGIETQIIDKLWIWDKLNDPKIRICLRVHTHFTYRIGMIYNIKVFSRIGVEHPIYFTFSCFFLLIFTFFLSFLVTIEVQAKVEGFSKDTRQILQDGVFGFWERLWRENSQILEYLHLRQKCFYQSSFFFFIY